MAEETNETPEEQILDLTEEAEAPEVIAEAPEATGDEEVVVSFGEEEAAPASEDAPEWVRNVRKRNRELERENAELKKSVAPQVPEVGPKPTLESCDYDEERFETEFNSYLDRKSQAEIAQTEAQKSQQAVAERYQAKVATYVEQRQSLGAKDFDDAEVEVLGTLNDAQKAILVHGAENKAALVYALGRHPDKLRSLASISDPIEFAFAAARLEATMKTERRRPATTPESQVRGGTGSIAQAGKLDDRLSAAEWAQRRNEQVRKR
jgi:hypothetical protein